MGCWRIGWKDYHSIDALLAKLPQKSQIILKEQPDIVDPVF